MNTVSWVLRSFLLIPLLLKCIDLMFFLTVFMVAFGLTSKTLGELRKEKDHGIFIIQILEQIQSLEW